MGPCPACAALLPALWVVGYQPDRCRAQGDRHRPDWHRGQTQADLPVLEVRRSLDAEPVVVPASHATQTDHEGPSSTDGRHVSISGGGSSRSPRLPTVTRHCRCRADQTRVTLYRSGICWCFPSSKFRLCCLAEQQIVDLGVVGSNPTSHPNSTFQFVSPASNGRGTYLRRSGLALLIAETGVCLRYRPESRIFRRDSLPMTLLTSAKGSVSRTAPLAPFGHLTTCSSIRSSTSGRRARWRSTCHWQPSVILSWLRSLPSRSWRP
jgi:hypothetical protein